MGGFALRRKRSGGVVMGELPGPGSTREQLAERLRFLSCNEMAIQLAFAKVRAAGQDPDVVAMVIDARDSLGREIAGVVDPEHRVDRVAGPNMIPTVLMLMPRRAAHAGLRETHPRIAAGLANPAPSGAVAVVCIAAEGITLVHVPIVEPPAAASA